MKRAPRIKKIIQMPSEAARTAPDEAEFFITRKELARRLRGGVRTVDRWTAAKVIPFYRLPPKLVVFRWSEVEAHLRDHFRVSPKA
jgi:excisionase family DNA binding protein